jgi:hypothetical protein
MERIINEENHITFSNYYQNDSSGNNIPDPNDDEMEEALRDFYLEHEYTTSDIIRYSVMVSRLRPEIKKKLTCHSDFNKLFFEDLKKGNYLARLFKNFPESNWLSSKFRLIKHEINDFLNDDYRAHKLNSLVGFLLREESKNSIHFG